MRHNHGDPSGARRVAGAASGLRAGWAVAVPAKPLHRAKSRMSAQLPDAERRLLVRAMLGDVLEAVAGATIVGSFAVVTADPELAALARSLGAEIVPEFGAHLEAPSAGSSAAPAQVVSGGDSTFRRAAALGLDWAARRSDDVAVLASDLPGITSAALAEVLAEAESLAGESPTPIRGFVPDADGLGTTAATFSHAGDLRTFFGPRSAADFAASGAVALGSARPGIRRDVDSLEHIAELGSLGRRTAEALDRVGDAARAVIGALPPQPQPQPHGRRREGIDSTGTPAR